MGKKAELRLKPEEAIAIGLNPKPRNKYGNPKYSLSKKQHRDILKLRSDEISLTGESILEDADGNAKLVWKKHDYKLQKRLEAFRCAVEEMKSEIPKFTPREPTMPFINSNLINQYMLTDFHLGMMAWGEETGSDWDISIGEEVMVEYFRYAIENSPKTDTAIFAQLGDFLHWDGMDAVTPQNRHLLDADTRFQKLVRVAIRVIRRVIDMLLRKYRDVHVIMAEGNHDMASSIWLREVLHSMYENEPRINIETRPDPYYCFQWGQVGLFYHHGHKRNINNIDAVFASKFKKVFGECEHLYGHIGHLHHKKMIESILMIIEQHRTLSAKDAYASRGGWLSGRDSSVITYHKKYGEVDRKTINIKIVMDALEQRKVREGSN